MQLPGDMGKHKAVVEKIRNLSGDEFDKAFMKMQVKHHKNDVKRVPKRRRTRHGFRREDLRVVNITNAAGAP